MNVKRTVSRILRRDEDAEAAEMEAPDALTLLRNDHAEVNALFDAALADDADDAARRDAVRQILEKLSLHTQMEETIFYPALRKAGGEEENETVLEAFEEHGVAKDLIAKIGAIGRRRDETLRAKLTVLKEAVRHHIEEEESAIFDQARNALGDERLAELGETMQAFKESGGRTVRRRETARRTPSRTESREASRKRAPAREKTAKKSSTREASAKKSSTRETSAKKTTAARGKKSAGAQQGEAQALAR